MGGVEEGRNKNGFRKKGGGSSFSFSKTDGASNSGCRSDDAAGAKCAWLEREDRSWQRKCGTRGKPTDGGRRDRADRTRTGAIVRTARRHGRRRRSVASTALASTLGSLTGAGRVEERVAAERTAREPLPAIIPQVGSSSSGLATGPVAAEAEPSGVASGPEPLRRAETVGTGDGGPHLARTGLASDASTESGAVVGGAEATTEATGQLGREGHARLAVPLTRRADARHAASETADTGATSHRHGLGAHAGGSVLGSDGRGRHVEHVRVRRSSGSGVETLLLKVRVRGHVGRSAAGKGVGCGPDVKVSELRDSEVTAGAYGSCPCRRGPGSRVRSGHLEAAAPSDHPEQRDL